ncbi:porin [Paraburkholderia susongensis]|uniref:Outer membrane protein (Porin) n=1 Tax=Paraburkholderia susongensis TaxID=1515439 RepID=A0A1X7LQS2_9BURK|nr:porin [Paraburkholderia susongensis]SMG55469.1 Outer membrane protein (porin) [Paraburkholderia susongensis]
MKQKVIGACLLCAAGAISSTAMAQSSVTMYGLIDTGIAYVSNQKGNSNLEMVQGVKNGSRFGFTGQEDLGGGTQAIFTLEGGFNSITGAQGATGYMFNRQAFVGVANETYGTLTAGRQYTPYFYTVGALSGLGGGSPLTGWAGAHPGDIDGMDTGLRINNSVMYTSPDIRGFQARAMYALGGVAGDISADHVYGASLMYSNGPFEGAVGFNQINNSGKNLLASPTLGNFASSAVNSGYMSAQDARVIGLSARYAFGKLMVGVSGSNVSYTPGAESLFTDKAIFNTAAVFTAYKLGNLLLGAGYAYTRATEANGIKDAANYNQITLGQLYSVSKRTRLYFLQAYQRAGGQTLYAPAVSTGTPAVPVIQDAVATIGDGQNSTPSSGRNQFTIVAGIQHTF